MDTSRQTKETKNWLEIDIVTAKSSYKPNPMEKIDNITQAFNSVNNTITVVALVHTSYI